MEEKNIHMGLGVGGLTKPMCELLDRGLARKLVDTQDFDLDAVNNVRTNPNHFPISAGEYASPMNKGAFVNKMCIRDRRYLPRKRRDHLLLS